VRRHCVGTARAKPQRIAVGHRAGDRGEAEGADRAGSVVDEELLIEVGGQLLRQDPRDYVG
jgi:hypothetical protein